MCPPLAMRMAAARTMIDALRGFIGILLAGSRPIGNWKSPAGFQVGRCQAPAGNLSGRVSLETEPGLRDPSGPLPNGLAKRGVELLLPAIGETMAMERYLSSSP
jgi:hypothetical protein